LITDPVFTALIFPATRDTFYVDTDREVVDDIAYSNVKLAFGIGNVSFSRRGDIP
jgi:hypothetical protein